MRRRDVRLWGSLALAVLLVAGAVAVLAYFPTFLREDNRPMAGWLLLLGIPGFYLLTFASVVEESVAPK